MALFNAGLFSTYRRPNALAMLLTEDVIDFPCAYHVLLLAPQEREECIWTGDYDATVVLNDKRHPTLDRELAELRNLRDHNCLASTVQGLCHSGSLLCIPRSCPMCSRPRTKNATRVAIFFCGGAQKQRYKRVIIRSPRALSGSTTNLAGCKSCSTNRAADTCFRAGFDHGWHEHVTGSQDARTAAVFFLFW